LHVVVVVAGDVRCCFNNMFMVFESFQLIFLFIVAIICSRCFNFIIPMLEMLFFFVVAVYMFVVFQLLHPIVVAVSSFLLQ
jgi:hypothetical protein